MKYLFLMVAALPFLCSCRHHKEDEPEKKVAEQTILVYIAADNNLSKFVSDDIRQMIEASKTMKSNENLILFVDQTNTRPYIAKVSDGDTTHVLHYTEELKTSDAETMRMALEWTMENYEARHYGLILWGHADGWIIKEDAASSRPKHAYAQDLTGKEQWMNIPDMARALESLPTGDNGKLLRFIFADCCCFQSVESAYELRNCTDYIIASAAEIPGEGAPYHTVVPALFSQSDDFANQAVDAYYEQVSIGYQEPLSVVKTSELDNLAQATRTVLAQNLRPLSEGYPDMSGMIYYFQHSLFDMNDFILRNATDANYTEWKRVFSQAVPYSKMTTVWMANFVPYLDSKGTLFRDFDVTEEHYGGVSMFVPQDPETVSYSYRSLIEKQNQNIRKMQWYNATGLEALGW